jgi:uroporphyrinogen-III synthase
VCRGHSCPPTSTMKKKPKSTNTLPLKNLRVLVGRTRHQASALSRELRKLGATVLEIPFIEIRKPKSFKALDAALKSLAEYDWLILTSVNGVEAMWNRLAKLKLDYADLRAGARADFRADTRTDARAHLRTAPLTQAREGHDFSRAVSRKKPARALAPEDRLRIAAIGPATKNAIERRGRKVDVVPKEYVAESIVRSLRTRVKRKRVLLVRAKVARDVIPRELRKAGAHVDVIEAYETVVPQSSRKQLRNALRNPRRRPHLVTFTSSSTVRNFVALLGERESLEGIRLASIGPVTSSTLRELGLPVDLQAKQFTIPGLVKAIVRAMS